MIIKHNYYLLNLNKYGTHKIIGRYIKNEDTVLDIGCNQGYLKKICGANNQFWGIDFDNEALELAKKVNKYVKVYKCDLNNRLVKVNQKFDVLVFGDVLEHLIDPDRVLKYFVENNLKKDGIVVISLPNVANITVRLRLLLGIFDYSDCGILDRSHLHLYTTKTAIEFINKANLELLSIRYSSNKFGWVIDKLNFLGSLLGYNIILVCKKRKY